MISPKPVAGSQPPASGRRTIVIAGGGTGGHLMPALAIATEVRRAHPQWRVVLVGAARGVEAVLLPTRDFPYHLLNAEPIHRRQWWKNFRWPLLAVRLLREVNRVLDEERPALVVGTGGYAAGPLVWRAARRGIPTALQEQNAYPGLVTRWLAGSVREIWLGVPEARSHLSPGPTTEVLLTGTPIVSPDPAQRSEALSRFGLSPSRPVLLVTGGSQGALAINTAVAAWLDSGGGKDVQILWATGRATYGRFQRYHRPPGVQLFDFLDPMSQAYAVADLAVSRAGMMTIAELSAWGVPSILIPLPTAAADHQTPNARVLAAAGGALHLPEADLSGSHLGGMITDLLRAPDRLATMAAKARSRGHPGAVARITERIGILSG